jgi:creatinine amidohydrolase/Fe(II)-dependent formamide hydrolase-like protein
MSKPSATRAIGELTFAEIPKFLSASSILCLPVGAIEQHGPHLPLDTDVVIAEGIARRLVERYAAEFDTWQLPSVTISLSREHEWAAGTLSLSITAFTAMMRDLAQTIVRSLPARDLVIVNGHGGNRGILQNLIYEMKGDFGLNVCVLHPLAAAQVKAEGGIADIHAGLDETSLMLALAPGRVRRNQVVAPKSSPDAGAIAAMIVDQGVTWPWSSGDPHLACGGVTGDPSGATAEFGEKIIESILAEARPMLERLRQERPKRG